MFVYRSVSFRRINHSAMGPPQIKYLSVYPVCTSSLNIQDLVAEARFHHRCSSRSLPPSVAMWSEATGRFPIVQYHRRFSYKSQKMSINNNRNPPTPRHSFLERQRYRKNSSPERGHIRSDQARPGQSLEGPWVSQRWASRACRAGFKSCHPGGAPRAIAPHG